MTIVIKPDKLFFSKGTRRIASIHPYYARFPEQISQDWRRSHWASYSSPVVDGANGDECTMQLFI